MSRVPPCPIIQRTMGRKTFWPIVRTPSAPPCSDFLARVEAARTSTKTVTLPQGMGEYAGITYHILGSGPPLVLLPLIFAPSQWEPIPPLLSTHFCTITLSGANVGSVAILEARGRSDYLRVVRNRAGGCILPSGGQNTGGGLWVGRAEPLAGPAHSESQPDHRHGHQPLSLARGGGPGNQTRE